MLFTYTGICTWLARLPRRQVIITVRYWQDTMPAEITDGDQGAEADRCRADQAVNSDMLFRF